MRFIGPSDDRGLDDLSDHFRRLRLARGILGLGRPRFFFGSPGLSFWFRLLFRPRFTLPGLWLGLRLRFRLKLRFRFRLRFRLNLRFELCLRNGIRLLLTVESRRNSTKPCRV